MAEAFPYRVNPALNAQGQLQYLVDLVEHDDDAKPVSLPSVLAGGWAPLLIDEELDVTAAAKLGVTPAFQADAAVNRRVMVWDGIVGQYFSSLTGAFVRRTLWGIGFRTILSYTKIDVAADVNVSIVAAKAEVNSLKVEYEIRSIGLGRHEMAKVLREIPPVGRFGVDIHSKLKSLKLSMTDSLTETLKDPIKAREVLMPIEVELSKPLKFNGPLDEAQAWRFAMKRIAVGQDLNVALQHLAQAQAWKRVDADLLKTIYHEFLSGQDKPSPSDQARAKAWL